jgi:hypothetical protein
VFDFVIPRGETGPPGASITEVASVADLPAGQAPGTVFLTLDTGDLYRADGTKATGWDRISQQVASTGIEDSTAVGRAVVVAADEKAGRTALVAERHRTFNVLDFGAVGDGVADDRAAIHAARDAAGVGGRVFFPKGTYKVVGLSPGASGYKFGAGGLWANVEGQTWLLDQSTLVYSGGSRENLITVSAPNVTVRGGTLDLSAIAPGIAETPPNRTPYSPGVAVWSGTVATGVDYGPHGTGAAGAVIDGVTIKDAPGYGVHVLNTNSVTVKDCFVKDFVWSGIFVQTGTGDIHDFVIDGNRLESKWASFAAPLYIGGNDKPLADFVAKVNRVRHARITNNSCSIPSNIHPGQGSFFNGGSEAGAIQLSNIEDSILDGNTSVGGAFGITCAYMRRVVISNNTCRRFRGTGIETSAGHESVIVSGNTVDSDGAGGPYSLDTGLQDPAGTLNLTGAGILSSCGPGSWVKNYTITGNTVTGFTTTAKIAGVQLAEQGSFENVTISGNTITAGSTTGGEFMGVRCNSPSTNLTVSGNTFDGGGADRLSFGVAIQGKTQTGLSITGNNFSNMGRAAFEPSKLTDGVFTDFHFRGNMTRNCFMVLRGDAVTAGGITRFFHDVGLVRDTSGNTSAEFTAVTNAVNYLQFRNSPTLGDVAVRAMGTDTDISVNMWPKGAGVVKANGTQVEVKGHTHTVAQVTGARSWAAVPASSTAAGTAGQEAYDATWRYVCVTTGAAGAALWKRTGYDILPW